MLQVPKGFPYFAVDFGLQGGFAHIIEDENHFPHYFGRVSFCVVCSHSAFTLRPLADLFITTTTRFPLEEFSHAAINAQKLFAHIFPPLSIARYSFIRLSEPRHRGKNKNSQASKRQQMGFEPILSLMYCVAHHTSC